MNTVNKMRVYEVARDLGMTNKDLVAMFQSLGFSEVRNHMSAVEPDAVERIKRRLERKGDGDRAVQEQRVGGGVIKRRAKPDQKAGAAVPAPMPSAPASRRSRPEAPSAAEAAVEARPSAPAQVPPAAPAEAPSEPAAEREPRAARTQPEPEVSLAPAMEALAPAAAAETHPSEPAQPSALDSSASRLPVRTPRALASDAPRQVAASPSQLPRRPSQAPKSGIEVWEGRPGVPMPQRPRAVVGGPAGAPRRTTYDPRASQQQSRQYGYGQRPIAGRPVRPAFRRGPPLKGAQRRPTEVSTKEMSAHKMVIRIEGETSLQSLAGKMALKATDVLMKLLGMGMTGVNINSTLDSDTAKLLASEFGWTVEDVSVNVDEQLEQATQQAAEEATGDEETRPPIVTVMGHVDHGKTSLLDTIRRAQVAAGEAGGITQHIGAYRVEKNGHPICFLDTPGHEAFTAMRARGAQLTDLVILVVAADDGVMPQTREAIAHARSAEVPIIVAINKMDKPGADPDRIMRDLANEGLQPEDWGGETIVCKLSAKTGDGVDHLLEMIALQSEMLELRAQPSRRASGVVIEALLDRGRGPVARVLVQDGTLHRGDVLLAGTAYGKIRAMTDEKGRMLKDAGPSTPVEVLGLDEVPSAGDPAHAVKDLKSAEQLADERRKKLNKPKGGVDLSGFSLEKLREKLAEAEQLELKIILKADVQGSLEALSQALGKLSTKKVKLSIVHTGVGAITETDVNLAVAAQAIIIGFSVRPAGKAKKIAEQEKIEMRLYDIIYEVIDDVKGAMEGLLPATKVEKQLGKAEVRQLFHITKVGTVAGCMVVEGAIKRTAQVRLVRDHVVVWTGKIGTLKRFKDDAREVKEGFECGIGLEGYNDLKESDVIEAFEIEEVKAKLGD